MGSCLLVDADPGMTAVIEDALARKGWTIVHAPNNQAVLEMVSKRYFDVIVTDEKSTAQVDIELLRKIRRAHPHVRMIIVADGTTPADVVSSLRAQAFSIFSWPLSLDTLAEMIQRAVEEPAWDDGIEVVSATPAWLRLTVRCDLRTAERLVQFLRELSELAEPEQTDVATAFREILINAMEHGGGFDPQQYVEIGYVRTRRAVICRVKDPGKGFSLEELKHAAISNPADDPIRHMVVREAQGLRPGGLGLMLTKHLVDEVIYGEQGNDVLLIKYLNQPGGPAP